MIRLLIAVAAMLSLAGCQSSQLADFFGTSDPCAQGAALHIGFQALASTQPKIAKYAKAEHAGYAAFKAQCSDGNVKKVTLQKALAAYMAAVADYKS